MLHLLAEYARKHDLVVEPGFKPKDVRWCIVCDADGQYLDVVELGDTSQKRNRGMTFHRCPEYSFSELKAGGVTKCHFLVETAEVVVLHSKKPDDPKVVAKHNYFLKMLHDAGSVIPELTRLSNHLSQPVTLREICIRMEALKVKPTDKVTFRTGDSFPVESDAWHDWWRKLRKTVSDDQSEQKHRSKRNKSPCQMRCFLTGELAYPAPTHPKIEGLSSVGGLATGDVLIGFKQDSFRSYGLVQSTNAAVSEVSASIYRAALNHIIKERGQRLAGAMVVHWFRENVPDEDDPLPWLNTGGETEELNAQRRARELLESIRAGNRSDLQGNHYYAITLSGASGRVMVRDWMEGQFDELVENIRQWFDDLEVVDRRGQGMARPPKFFAVLGATVRDLDELSAPFVSKLWRVAVRCEPIPKSALS